MELSDLKVFKAVVETGGISSAAKQLHRVPSNITARIQKLESELETSLFIRENNRVRVSPSGEQLIGYAEQILSLADEAVENLNQQAPSGRLNVGSMEAVAASRLSPVLSEYHQAYAKVELVLQTGPTGLLIDQVLSGELDLALVADPVLDSRLEILPIFEERLVLVSNISYEVITNPEDLGDNPTLLGFSARCAYRSRLSDWVNQSDRVANVIEINSYHALLNCVAAGMGVGFVPEVLLDLYPFKEDIRVHSVPEAFACTTTCLIWRKDSVKPSMEAFQASLLKVSSL